MKEEIFLWAYLLWHIFDPILDILHGVDEYFNK